MLRIAVVFITGLAVAIGFDATPAEACGVKLTVKSPRVKKRVRHTAHPSHVLVLGAPPSKKLSRWLKQAGHKVEISQDANKAKRDEYAVVIADPEKVNEARSAFPNTRVVTRSGSLSSNVRKLERVLAQSDSGETNEGPVRVASGRTRQSRNKTRQKPSEPTKIEEPTKSKTQVTETRPTETRVATRDNDDTGDTSPTVTTPTEPAPSKLTRSTDSSANDTDVDDTDDVSQPVRPKLADKDDDDDNDTGEDMIGPKQPEKVDKGKPGRWSKELYFGTNRDGLTRGQRKQLMGNVKWLQQNPDANVTIEGHTDAQGPDEYNRLLGERRAEAVRAFLVDQGIDESRLEVISYGEERPAYKNAKKNRRVVLVKN